MNIEEALYELNSKLYAEYGIKDMIHTVIMNPENFDKTIIELFRSNTNSYQFRPSDMNNLSILGVRVLARDIKHDL